MYVLIKMRIHHWYAYVYGFRQYADRFFGFLHLHNGCSDTIQWVGLGLGLGFIMNVVVQSMLDSVYAKFRIKWGY